MRIISRIKHSWRLQEYTYGRVQMSRRAQHRQCSVTVAVQVPFHTCTQRGAMVMGPMLRRGTQAMNLWLAVQVPHHSNTAKHITKKF